MKKDHYIGVDISKKTFDVAVYVNSKASKCSFPHESFNNSEEGFKEMRSVNRMLSFPSPCSVWRLQEATHMSYAYFLSSRG